MMCVAYPDLALVSTPIVAERGGGLKYDTILMPGSTAQTKGRTHGGEFLAAMPPILFCIFLQRYIIQGIALTGLKA